MTERRPRFIHCACCNKKVAVGPIGAIPKYCGNACRQQTFKRNQRGNALARDERQRMLIWGVLQDAGLIPTDKPLPMRVSEPR